MAKDAADREAADQVHACHVHHLCRVLIWHKRPGTPELNCLLDGCTLCAYLHLVAYHVSGR